MAAGRANMERWHGLSDARCTETTTRRMNQMHLSKTDQRRKGLAAAILTAPGTVLPRLRLSLVESDSGTSNPALQSARFDGCASVESQTMRACQSTRSRLHNWAGSCHVREWGEMLEGYDANHRATVVQSSPLKPSRENVAQNEYERQSRFGMSRPGASGEPVDPVLIHLVGLRTKGKILDPGKCTDLELRLKVQRKQQKAVATGVNPSLLGMEPMLPIRTKRRPQVDTTFNPVTNRDPVQSMKTEQAPHRCSYNPLTHEYDHNRAASRTCPHPPELRESLPSGRRFSRYTRQVVPGSAIGKVIDSNFEWP